MDWLTQYARPVVDSFVYSVLGTLILCCAIGFVGWIIPFSVKKEIEVDQNTSLGIILGAFIIGISMIIAAAIHG